MIVDRLSRGECGAGDLTKLLGLNQSTVSRHLGVLRAYGIIDDRREGGIVIYTLLTPCVVNFLSCATQVLKESRPFQPPRSNHKKGPSISTRSGI